MSDRFNKARRGEWVAFCDICGQKCYSSEMTKLSNYTGRGGLIVCKNDVDKIDYGLVPYKVPSEQPIPWARVNHTNTTNGAAVINYETTTQLGV